MGLGINRIDVRERHYIVGRDDELKEFVSLLGSYDEMAGPSILHIYGTGGVGKSTFLRLCRHAAEQARACFLMLDSRDFVHTEQGLCSALLRLLREREGLASSLDGDSQQARERCLEALQHMSQERRIVVAFDTFEEMQDMETWLRDRLVPWLPDGTVVLLAGRHPLKGVWVLMPAWRERLRQVALKPLEREDCMEYLDRCGLRDANLMERIWRQAKGHPLALSLAAATSVWTEADQAFTASTEPDWFGELAALWLKEVPDQELRKWVEAASIVHHFNQELLMYIMQEEIPSDVFDRLIALSFVRTSERGWQQHDLMRDSISSQLKERSPRQYQRLKERSAAYYAQAILDQDGSGGSWEVGELFRYAGIKVIRALVGDHSKDRLYWETVTESTLDEAVAYVEWRRSCSEGVSGNGIDPETGEAFLIQYSADELRYSMGELDVSALFKLDPQSLKLLRDQTGSAVALAAIIPIHAQTLPRLMNDLFCGPYLASLSEQEKLRMEMPRERPAGWFMKAMDFQDLMNPLMRTAGVYLLYEYMCSGGVFVCSPYPSEISRNIYPSLGFNVVEGAAHRNYDGSTLAFTYTLDTRGDGLQAFIEGLMRKSGIVWKPVMLAASLLPDEPAEGQRVSRSLGTISKMTGREAEVAELVLSGCSNAEIASRLYISEVTVKKHLKSIYGKLGIRTRTQLAALMAAEGAIENGYER